MELSISVFNLLAFIVVWRGTTATSQTSQFKKESTMTDLRCSTSTSEIGVVRSVKHCSMMCSSTDSCNSFFYNSPLRTCWISSEVFDAASGCGADSGTVYYSKTGLELMVYGSACTLNTDCTMSNMVCEAGVCMCDQWYIYDQTTGQCTDTCTVYGTTYILYSNIDVGVAYTDVGITSLQECLDACSASPSCRGVNFCCMPSPLCRLKDGTPLSHPGSESSISGVDYHMRDCA